MINKRNSINVYYSDKYVYFAVIDHFVTRIFIDEIDALNYIQNRVSDNRCNCEYKIKRILLEDIYND